MLQNQQTTNKKGFIGNVIIILMIGFGYWFSNSFFYSKGMPINPIKKIFQGAQLVYSPKGDHLHDAWDNMLKSSYNKPLLVHFSANWCHNCKREEPFFKDILVRHLGDDISIVSVYVSDVGQEEIDLQEGFHKLKELKIPVFYDSNQSVSDLYQVRSLPSTLLFDGKGNLAYRIKGGINENNRAILDAKIVQLKGSRSEVFAEAGHEEHNHEVPEDLTVRDLRKGLFQAPDVKLVDHTGGVFTSESLKGRVWAVNFIFTTCKSMCPIFTRQMSYIDHLFHKDKDFRLMSISVDPKNDTPDRLKLYMRAKKINPDRWHFLTGDWSYIRNLMVDGFRLEAPDDPVFHTDKVVLVNQEGKIVGQYSSLSKASLQMLREDINKLLSRTSVADPS